MPDTQPNENVLTIDLARWIRGTGGTRSFLKRPDDGHMCCLGFDACAQGLPDTWIEGASDPEDIASKIEDADDFFVAMPEAYLKTRYSGVSFVQEDVDDVDRHLKLMNSKAVLDLIEANDAPDLSLRDRQTKIRALMIEHFGYTDVRFIGGAPSPELR